MMGAMTIEPEIQARIRRLTQELDALIKPSGERAMQTHWLTIGFMLIALMCSGLAGIGGIAGFLPKTLIGILALVPVAVAIAAMTFKPQARSSWHCRKSDALNSLRSRLLYQLPVQPSADNVAAIARARDELIEQMQAEWDKEFGFNWAAFSAPPAHPPAPPPGSASGAN
jgi:hypothetical protein